MRGPHALNCNHFFKPKKGESALSHPQTYRHSEALEARLFVTHIVMPWSPRSRSLSPRQEDRKRNRSPRARRDEDKPRRREGGFRWKEKRRDEDDSRRGNDERRLERGYREQDRPRSPRRDRDEDRNRDDGERRKGREDRESRPEEAPRDSDKDKESKDKDKEKRKKERREKKAAAAAATGEPMIIVNVNDRLGTKAAVPCLASDPIRMSLCQHPVVKIPANYQPCRSLQSPSCRANRPRAPRDPDKTPRRETVQRSAYA